MVALWHIAAHWIAQPWATIALLVAGCLLLYHDLLTPLTWGSTGTIGSIAVALVFAGHLTTGTGAYWGVLLLLAGLSGILLEIHLWPGRGSAIAGFILMYAGMYQALGGVRHAGFSLTVTTILIVVSGLAFLAYLPKSPAWQRVGLELSRRAEFALDSDSDVYDDYLGHPGKSLTQLRPTGYALIDGHRLKVVTEGEFLEPGTPIIVTEIDNGRIVVHEESRTPALTAS